MLMENTADHERAWPHLLDVGTGRTLSLGPGDHADVNCWDGTEGADLPADFDDVYLKPARQPKKKTTAVEQAADPEIKE